MAHFDESLHAEQEAYAGWLAWGTRVGFFVLVATYFLYVTGVLAPAIAPERLPELWRLPLAEYLAASHAPTGWRWVLRLGQGEALNLVGVAILAATTIACYVRVLPVFLRRRERIFVAICIVEVAVLLAAAAGVF
jgi:hypothetical protein